MGLTGYYETKEDSDLIVKYAINGTLIILSIMILLGTFYTIQAGERGILLSFGIYIGFMLWGGI